MRPVFVMMPRVRYCSGKRGKKSTFAFTDSVCRAGMMETPSPHSTMAIRDWSSMMRQLARTVRPKEWRTRRMSSSLPSDWMTKGGL